jgi:hypothetical protein
MRTGGSTLDAAYLAPCFPFEKRCRGYDGYHEIFIKIRDKIFLGRSFSQSSQQQIDAGKLPIDRLYYSGHIPFGLHTVLPIDSLYITTIRNPIDRIFSQYKIACAFQSDLVFDDFIENKSHVLNNFQCRSLIKHPYGLDYKKVELVEECKQNLIENFIYCPTEQMSAMLKLLDCILPINTTMPTIILNKSVAGEYVYQMPNKYQKVSELTQNQIQHLLSKNKADIELYKWVCETYWVNSNKLIDRLGY